MGYIRRNIIFLALLPLLSFFCLALGTTLSPSRHLNVVTNHFDGRLSGLAENGWSIPDFGFKDPRISPLSADVLLEFAHGNRKDVKTEYFFNGLPAKTETLDNAILLKSKLSAKGTGIEIISKTLNPLLSKASGNNIGAKYSAVKIVPKFLLSFPSFDFGWVPFICVLTLLYLSSAAFNHIKLSILPAIPAAIALGLFLGQNKLELWDRAIWFWSFAVLLLCGIILCRVSPKSSGLKDSGKGPIFILVLLIFCAGAYLRFSGLNFGMPALFHPDESRKTRIIRTMVETGDLNPHYFRHPNFLLYSGAVNTWIASKIRGQVPKFHEVTYLARLVSAVLGSLSVLAVFFIGRLLFSPAAGAVAAAFLAFSPLHIVSSRYLKEDAALVFFTLCSVYFAFKSLKQNCDLKSNILAALFAGFSASSKFSGLLNLIFALLPCYERLMAELASFSKLKFLDVFRFNREKPGGGLKFLTLSIIIVCTVFAFGFLLFTPYAVLDYKTFIADFTDEKNHMKKGHTVAITALSYFWGFHIERSIFTWYQSFFAVLSFLGMGCLLFCRNMRGFTLIAAVLLYYLPAEWVNAKPEPQPERYILPCIPFLCLILGEFIRSQSKSPNKFASRIFPALSVIALIQVAAYSFLHTQSIKYDTRQIARDWIYENIPSTAKLVTDWHFYGPPDLKKRYQVLEIKERKDSPLNRNMTVNNLRTSGYDYLVLSSFWYGRYLMPAYRAHGMSQRFKHIFAELEEVKVFNNERFSFGFHNPEIRIYKIK